MRLITVSRKIDGVKVYVNPESICAVYPRWDNKEVTIIQFPGNDENYLEVIESVDRVASMIEVKNGKYPLKGEWLRMSDLSEKDDDRYTCSRCGNVIHYESEMDLYTFNSWCGRCGSDNGR